MISPISFSSTYIVNGKNPNAFNKFLQYTSDNEKAGTVTRLYNYRDNSHEGKRYIEETLIAPDYMDDDIETYCANNGISYTKLKTEDLLNAKTINQRVKPAKNNYRLVNIYADKLEELASNQNSNIPYCNYEYTTQYHDKIEQMFKSGDAFPTTTLFICPKMSNKELKKYVENFEAEKPNDEEVMIDFYQSTNEPDHCVYFGLKDLGMDKIPVYVDDSSYEAGKILGLFSEEA